MNSKKPQSEIYYNQSSLRKPLDIHTNMLAPETLDCTHFIKKFSVEDQLLQTCQYTFILTKKSQKITYRENSFSSLIIHI